MIFLSFLYVYFLPFFPFYFYFDKELHYETIDRNSVFSIRFLFMRDKFSLALKAEDLVNRRKCSKKNLSRFSSVRYDKTK